MLTQSLLPLIGMFAVASMVGAWSYVTLVYSKDLYSQVFFSLFIVFWPLPTILLYPISSVAIASALAPCFISSKYECIISGLKLDWKLYLRTFAATYQTVMLGMVVLAMLAHWHILLEPYFGSNLAFGVTYLVIFCLTVPAISFFRWVILNSKLRPGLDRHLQEGESDPQ